MSVKPDTALLIRTGQGHHCLQSKGSFFDRFLRMELTWQCQRVRGSSEKAVEDLFQMYEAVREDADDKQPK